MVTSAEVLIVGAGPTGLTLACDLYRRGVACRLLDRRDGVGRRSRGKGIQSRTLEVFDDLGVAATALAAGRTDHRLRLYAGGALAADLIAPARPARPGVPYPNLLVCRSGAPRSCCASGSPRSGVQSSRTGSS